MAGSKNHQQSGFSTQLHSVEKRRENSKGGGVLIAVKNTFLSSDVPELQTTCDSCEIIWVKINIVNCKTLYICYFYNPSTSDEFSMINFSESINRAANMKDAFLLIDRDFNLPGWDWKTRTLKPNTKHPITHYRIADILDDNGLVQVIEEPTRNKNTLDLLITNIPSTILRTDIIPGISDHDIVYAEIDIKPVKHKQTPRKIPLYKKAEWDSIRSDLSLLLETIQNKVLVGADVNQLWDTFTNNLQESINNHVPQKIAKSKDKFPWITKEIKQMIRRRDRMYKRKKKIQPSGRYQQVKKLKQLVQRKMRQAYWNYIEEVISIEHVPEQNNRTNTKKFWTYNKHRKKDNSTITGLKVKGCLFTDPKQKAHTKQQALMGLKNNFKGTCKRDCTNSNNNIQHLIRHWNHPGTVENCNCPTCLQKSKQI